MQRRTFLAALPAPLLAQPKAAPQSFAALEEEFVYAWLALSPTSATGTGYHRHHGEVLDEQLDDLSVTGLERQLAFYERWDREFAKAAKGKLTADELVDLDMMRAQLALARHEIARIQSYRYNPTTYVELLGNALFTPYLIEYAPRDERYRHIIRRLQQVPQFADSAISNLKRSPRIWTEVAIDENEGNIALVDKTIRSEVPAALKPEYDTAAKGALNALRSLNTYLTQDLSKTEHDWRLGNSLYGPKFRHTLQTGDTPEQVLTAAEAELAKVREQMRVLANEIAGTSETDVNKAVKPVLDRIAQEHTTAEKYFSTAQADLADTTAFVRRKQLLDLGDISNLKVIDTPEFMRGLYSVGGFSQAPALQPELGAFYWLTPLAGLPQERIESKLREYNRYGLKLLTIHEAMPGHYVQFQYAGRVEPQPRRVVRSVFGNGANVEGWAVYATEMMLDEGYLESSKALRLTFLKQQLRMIANAILDIRLHTKGMTDAQAMSLMLDQGFQEKEEAAGKLRRAKLSSCQLPTYYVGWRDWRRLRGLAEKSQGGGFRLAAFHEAGLRPGAVPVPALAKLMGLTWR